MEHSNDSEIYLIDNASSDDSLNFVRTNFPSVKTIEFENNLGFARAYNKAVSKIDASLICLLNNDVEVTPNWLEPIKRSFENDSVQIIQPKILDYYRRGYFEYAGAAGGFLDKYGFPYCRGRIFQSLERDQNQFNDEAEIFWASGACFFIRKNLFTELEGFDPSFFAHMEEIDLCWRAQNRGKTIMYKGESVVYHMGGATLSNSSPRKTLLNFRNSLVMMAKNLPKGNLFGTLFVRLAQDGIAAIYFLSKGQILHSFMVLRSHVEFFWRLIPVLRKRNAVKRISNYYHTKSIVWSYFVNKKKTFNSL